MAMPITGFVDNVGAHNQGFGVGCGLTELCRVGIFLEQCKCVACVFDSAADAVDGFCREGFFGCY